MADNLVSVLGNVKHRFTFQVRSAVVVTENETTGDVFNGQIVDHERFTNICEMRNVIFVSNDEKIFYSDVQIDDLSRVEIAQKLPEHDGTNVVHGDFLFCTIFEHAIEDGRSRAQHAFVNAEFLSTRDKDNISPIVLWEFLRYLYTGEIVNLDIRVDDLFVVADKYDVPHLTDICESFMINNLTVENVSRCLVLGHNHNRPDLKSKSMLYIAQNGDQVIGHTEWKKVEEKYPVLVVEAFRLVFRMPKPSAQNAIEGF